MQLGETIATYDVALALRGESGKFEVPSPTGKIFHVTCKPNHSISTFQWSGDGKDPQPFLIRKVAQPASQEQGKATPAMPEGGPQTLANRIPFLLENQGDDSHSSCAGDLVDALPEARQDGLQSPETMNLDLLYLESDPRTRQPSACVCLKSGQADQHGKAGQLITVSCATFNEFDAEIRRLHARLDEIRYPARKKFHLAQAEAAGA